MGFPHHLDSSELCCRQAVTASRHLPSWQSPTDRRRTLLPYQSHRATQTPTTTLTPPTGIYGTPANSCNQMLPRDGTERHARLLYQLMPPHGRPGHKATTSKLSGKQIPDGASAGNIHVVRDSGKQPGEEPLQLAHHQSCRNVLPRARSPDPGIDSARKVGLPPSLQPPNQHARGSFSAAKRNTSLVHWVARLPMNQRPTTPSQDRPAWVFLGRVTLQRALPDLRAQATSLVASTSNGLPMWPWVHCQQLHDSVSLSTVDFACRGRWVYHVINSSQG